VQQAYLEAVQKRLRHETSRDCPATEEKWLLTELKSNEWWPRSHKAKWACDKLGLVMSEQAYYVDICAWLPDVRWGAAAMPPCPAAPALTLVLIAGAAITSSGELRPSTGTISWSADATGAPRGSGEDCKSNGDGGGHRGRARRGGSDGVATSCPGRGPRAQEANVNILLKEIITKMAHACASSTCIIIMYNIIISSSINHACMTFFERSNNPNHSHCR
jgi:hypothetical protein